MSVSSAVPQFGSAQGLGSKEQRSQIRAPRFARIMGFRSQRIVVMFPMRTCTWSIVHSYGLAAVVGWFRSKLPTGAAGGIPLSQPASCSGGDVATIRPLVGLFLNGAIEVHTTSIGTDW